MEKLVALEQEWIPYVATEVHDNKVPAGSLVLFNYKDTEFLCTSGILDTFRKEGLDGIAQKTADKDSLILIKSKSS